MAPIHDSYIISPPWSIVQRVLSRLFIPLTSNTSGGDHEGGAHGPPRGSGGPAVPRHHFQRRHQHSGELAGTNSNAITRPRTPATSRTISSGSKESTILLSASSSSCSRTTRTPRRPHYSGFTFSNAETENFSYNGAPSPTPDSATQGFCSARSTAHRAAERGSGNRRTLQDLRLLCPGRLQGELEADPQPGPAREHLEYVHRSE